MRILVVDASNLTLHYTVPFCNSMQNNGHYVKLICSSNSLNLDYDFMFFSFFSDRQNIFFRKFIKGFNYIIGVFKTISYVKNNKFDIVHFQISPLPMLDIFLLKFIRKYASVGATIHNTTPFHGNRGYKIQSIGFKKLLSMYDFLICHTFYSSNILKNNFNISSKKIFISNHPLFQKPKELSKKQNTPINKENNVLFFGTLSEYKGIDVLLKGFACLPPILKTKTNLIIAGKPLMNIRSLKVLANNLKINNRIKWKIGWIKDSELDNIFYDSDVMIMPYKHIDASGALVKAMEYNLPVIASNLGGFKELIDDKKTGFLFEANNHKELSQYMEIILENQIIKDKMKISMNERSLLIHSWDDLVNTCLRAYIN